MNEITQSQPKYLAEIPEELKALIQISADEIAEIEKTSIPFISTKGKKFTLKEEKIGTEFDAVILATAFDNAYYDRPYDPNEINPPACFAISLTGVNMTPNVTSPVLQHEDCSSCPHNQFGSATNGKGKSCKNGRRLLLAAHDGEALDLQNLAILRLPPTSLKGWASYAKFLAKNGVPTWSVVTNLKMDENEDFQKILPSNSKSIALTPHELTEISQNLDYYKELVSTPYDVSGYTEYAMPEEPKKKSKMS